MAHQVVLPITDGKLDLGRWEQVFYAEFDGRRRKRVIDQGDRGVSSEAEAIAASEAIELLDWKRRVFALYADAHEGGVSPRSPPQHGEPGVTSSSVPHPLLAGPRRPSGPRTTVSPYFDYDPSLRVLGGRGSRRPS